MNFDKDIFEKYCDELFEKSKNTTLPNKLLDKYQKDAKRILNDFESFTPPEKLPSIPKNFLDYIRANLMIGPFRNYIHSPVFYSTDEGKISFGYASPEVIEYGWVNFKITELWYLKLLELGYYVKKEMN